MAVAKMLVLHQLLKHDLLPDKRHSYKCPNCIEGVGPDDIDVLRDLNIGDTQSCFKPVQPVATLVNLYIGVYFKRHQHCLIKDFR